MRETRRALERQFERILGEHGAAISRLAYSYEAVNGIREELLQEIALAIWQSTSTPGQSGYRTCC